MKLLIIYNPQAGNGRAKSLLPSVESYLAEKGVEATFLKTESEGHAVELVANTDLTDFDGVIASGGDGTLYEVINGYYRNERNIKPPVGLIPNGTGNAFMKELGLLKSDWQKAVDIILNKETRALDVGKFETCGDIHYFLNIVGMGFVTDVAQAAIPLKWMGNAAYTAATLQKLISLKPQKFEIEVDGEKLERNGVFVEVANSRYTGTTFLMAPKAQLDDGKLDLVLLNDISKLRLLRLFTSIYDGSHINYPEVEYIQASKISVVEEKPGKLIPDGEVMGETPVSFECLHKDVEFFWGSDD